MTKEEIFVIKTRAEMWLEVEGPENHPPSRLGKVIEILAADIMKLTEELSNFREMF